MIESIDPKEAATIVDIIADDLPRPAAATARQRVVVRLLKQQRHRRGDLAPDARVRPALALVVGENPEPLRARNFRPRPELVREYVTYAATYQLYDSRRIVGELRAKFVPREFVRLSSVRALMYSVRLPEVHEGREFEEE